MHVLFVLLATLPTILGFQFAASTVTVASRKIPLRSQVAATITEAPFHELEATLQKQGMSPQSVDGMVQRAIACGWTNSRELIAFAADFQQRPEMLSKLLREDFEFSSIDSHKLRAALMHLISSSAEPQNIASNQLGNNQPTIRSIASTQVLLPSALLTATSSTDNNTSRPIRPLFKKCVVSSQALFRMAQNRGRDYGLRDGSGIPEQLSTELKEFMKYMTELSPNSQEAPIRASTADIYHRHATLFLGWYLSNKHVDSEPTLGLSSVFPVKDKDGATSVFEFIKWLRTERKISVSYEANVLRGLTKLAKFRFHKESLSDPGYGEKSFEDIPVIRELRKLHRDANRRQKLSPRVSDEKKKWLPWPEYLNVVQRAKADLVEELSSYAAEHGEEVRAVPVPPPRKRVKAAGSNLVTAVEAKVAEALYTPQHRRIADKYQKYLLLAFLATIPDRQRTFRELRIGYSFQIEELDMENTFGERHRYIIKHTPDDYKTGKTYGDRPPLIIAQELTKSIDEFISKWRPVLLPKGNSLFVQLRTGNPFSQDSIYQHVGRICYEHTGKRTNPHLLRDMIVTHVRTHTQASEKELEALALYMGHSIQMQRSSYDRRTLTQKVAPAVNLLEGLSRATTSTSNS